jgi:tetratricopeptide (TPR) repeat protein
MSYAGNPSLSSDIQKRVLGTFEQTLGLAAEGNRQEALLGCDFVLRMDSHFEPARQLQERLRNSSGPVRVDDLLAPAEADPFAGAINLDLPDLPAFGATAAPAPATAGPGDLRGRFQSFLEARRFQELLTLAQQQQEAVGRDPELMRMATAAQERMEAEPYVNKFLNAAREAARLGQRDEVARLSEKVRALDPSHPGLAALSGAAASAPAAPGFAQPAADASDMGFEMSFDDPAASLDLGTDLPDLSFDSPSMELTLDESAGVPSLDPELVSAADFAASMESSGDPETDRRIRELLNEGQRAYEGGDLQGAIDAWSRIFLIDIDHQEAARRIEQARKLKAESERQAEEVFHEGIAKVEGGDLQGAKQSFQRVLEIQPGYFAAREYLQQLEAGTVPTIKPVQRETSTQSALPRPSDLNLDTGTGELKEEILIPPDPSEVAAAERQRPKPRPIGVPARKGRARKLFVLVGSIVLVLALAGGAFVYLNRDRLFPNSQTDESATAGPAIADPIGRATELQKSGKTQSAISQLKRIPPSDPAYARAQELIKQWSANAPAGPAAGPTGTEPAAVPAVATPPPVSPERLATLTAARQAYQSGSYLEAIRRLEQASAQGPLEPADAEMLNSAKRQTEPLAAQLDLVHQHEWEHALRDLWRLHESEPANRDVTRLMVDSYYNMALRDLQRMDSAKAVENLHEALGLDPNDKGLQRQLAFAQTYQDRSKDLLYRIYVKHLPLR